MANYPFHSKTTIANGATVYGSVGPNGPIGPTGSSGSNLTVIGGGTSSIWTTTAPSYSNGSGASTGKIKLEGDNADIEINGVSLSKTLQTIQDRLAILVPDPKKLEQYEALKQAYEHYKTLEALCCETTTPKSDK